MGVSVPLCAGHSPQGQSPSSSRQVGGALTSGDFPCTCERRLREVGGGHSRQFSELLLCLQFIN